MLLGSILVATAAFLAMTFSMLVVGWFVWTRLQRQEADDPALRRKLEEDDERARLGRGG